MKVPQLLPSRKSYYWRTFALCFAAAALAFLPYVIADGGLFHYAGDFNSQQITFYQYMNDFVKQGGGYSWQTDLGSGAVNSYSFYLYGSPFFWLSCLLPSAALPYSMVPLLCLKFGVAGGGAYLWLRRYTKDGRMAVVGAVLYAFSGFTVYNVFFNHFVDVIALFPYMLWALDATIAEEKHGWFAFFVALNLVNNYFFFCGQVVFLIIYFVCRCSVGEAKLTGKLFGRLAVESLLGCGMGCVLAWPAVLSLMQNPRTVDLSSGYGFLLYGKVQQYFNIFFNFFIMPDAPYMSNMFNEGIYKWTSMTAYLPLCSAAGGVAWLRCKRKTAWKRILCTCIGFAFVPVLNSAFYMLNSSYYARWWYMPILILCAATVCGLESNRVRIEYGIRFCVAVCLASIVFAFVPVLDKESDTWSVGVVNDQGKFWLYLLVTLIGLVLFRLVVHCWRGKPQFANNLLCVLLVFSVLYTTLHFGITKLDQWDNDKNFAQQCYVEQNTLAEALPDDHFYRMDTYKCYDNLSLWTDIPCIRFFCSTVTPSILEFYPTVGVKRDVNSKPEQDLYALRGLLSVEYMVITVDNEDAWLEELPTEAKAGWSKAGASGSYVLYHNDNFVPMGFTYDHYITEETRDSVGDKAAAGLLLKAICLTDEQIESYGDLLTELPDADKADRSYTRYEQDCAARRADACTDFVADNTGFTASITLEKENLVFFTVPYDDGFTATVNGEETPIEKVSGGLSAVLCPAGENTIVFTYHTPGLRLSGAITLVCWALFALYLLACHIAAKKQKSPVDKTLPLAQAAVPEQTDNTEERKPPKTPDTNPGEQIQTETGEEHP